MNKDYTLCVSKKVIPVIYTSTLTLPRWIKDFIEKTPSLIYETLEQRMQFVLLLCKQNILHQTGGPFAAAIFQEDTGRLISVGVNRVVPLHNSMAHGEIMAFVMAQACYKSFDLGAKSLPAHQLVSSAQMCAMCCGATVWSGVKSVVYGANAQDVESIVGFDEGPIHPQWAAQLNERGIKIHHEVMRQKACDLLHLYKDKGGFVYNGRQ